MKLRKLSEYTIAFLVYAMFGWIYEVVLEVFIYRWGFSNRGVLYGPWLPVYGFGAVVFLLLWYRLIKGKPLKRKLLMLPVIFLATMLTATIIELGTSYILEFLTGAWPWQTYADYKWNFQARIALSPSIRFGIGGVLFLYIIQPILDKFLHKLSDKSCVITAIIIAVILLVDFACTIIIPYRSNAMKSPLEKQIGYAEKLWESWERSDTKRDAAIPEPLDIIQVVNIQYSPSESEEDTVWHLTDIYYPQNSSEELLPVIVNVHGGGWFYGTKQTYAAYTKYLAGKGFAVVNFNYRLSPINKYPVGFSDVCRLMQFLLENGERYHLDLSRVSMIGDSSGAQLALQYAVFASNEKYRDLFPEFVDIPVLKPSKLVLNCGKFIVEKTGRNETSDWYLPDEMTDAQTESLAHMTDYIQPDFPPCFLMSSVNDSLNPESRQLDQTLSDLQITHTFQEYGQENPKNSHVFHLNLLNDEAIQCNEAEIAFIRE